MSLVEEEVLTTFEGLVEAFEDGEEPMVFQQGKEDTLLTLGLNSGIGGRGEGSGGGRGRDEPMELESESSD